MEQALDLPLDQWHTLPRGVILGRADLIETFPTAEIADGPDHPQIPFGDYSPGRFAWHLAGAYALENPVPFRGRQRLFNAAFHCNASHAAAQRDGYKFCPSCLSDFAGIS